MINVNQLRNGKAFSEDGDPFLVLKYEFTKMGRGTGNIKVKVRNLESGAVVTKTYTTGNKVQDIQLTKTTMQFLYSDGENSLFMDPVTFEQIEISNKLIGDQKSYLVEGMEVSLLFWEEKALSIELPTKMTFEIAETDPGEKGNSATKVLKPATLVSGLVVNVPLFVNKGDKVVVDTRSGVYQARG
ncbi:MAG: elongation factor P [Candidatus Beckwithbacteria bacterium]|nr:elongation factor P [Patescibacteria group bacterium]